MRLTFRKRLHLIWEILTTTSGHPHCSNIKQLSTFQDGYVAGMKDAEYMDSLKYYELIYNVQSKHHGETRHQTALRYIRQAERNDCNLPQDNSAI